MKIQYTERMEIVTEIDAELKVKLLNVKEN